MFVTYRGLFHRVDLDPLIHSSLSSVGFKGQQGQSLFIKGKPTSVDRVQRTELETALPTLLTDGWKAIAISASLCAVLMGRDSPVAAE